MLQSLCLKSILEYPYQPTTDISQRLTLSSRPQVLCFSSNPRFCMLMCWSWKKRLQNSNPAIIITLQLYGFLLRLSQPFFRYLKTALLCLSGCLSLSLSFHWPLLSCSLSVFGKCYLHFPHSPPHSIVFSNPVSNFPKIQTQTVCPLWSYRNTHVIMAKACWSWHTLLIAIKSLNGRA